MLSDSEWRLIYWLLAVAAVALAGQWVFRVLLNRRLDHLDKLQRDNPNEPNPGEPNPGE